MAVTIGEETLPGGWRALRLRNEQLEVLLLPEKGSEIYALRSLRHGVDLLWKAPWGLRPPPVRLSSGEDSYAAWMDHYGGGWQELFPNGGDACTVAGAPLPFHGEASVAPWTCAIERGEASGLPEARLALRCTRLPFRLEKRVWLEADRPVLRLWERVTNEGAQMLPFMWGHHPAYGPPFLEDGCSLDVPARTCEASDPPISPRTWLASGRRSAWPAIPGADGATRDLSRIPGPGVDVANLAYLLDLEAGWYALSNPRLGLGIGLAWPLEVFPYLWLWQEFGGSDGYPWFGANYVMGVEPHTSYPGQGLARAVERGTARTLAPGSSLEMTLAAVLFEPRGRVAGVSTAGDVQFG